MELNGKLEIIKEERDVVVTRKELRGKTLAQAREMLDLRHRYGVHATRLFRLDQEIDMFPQTELHSGDVVRFIGVAEAVAQEQTKSDIPWYGLRW
jgi:uncharacterized transporter YbjL